jgi:hypothetical protein
MPKSVAGTGMAAEWINSANGDLGGWTVGKEKQIPFWNNRKNELPMNVRGSFAALRMTSLTADDNAQGRAAITRGKEKRARLLRASPVLLLVRLNYLAAFL